MAENEEEVIEKEFEIMRIYLMDASFEAPLSGGKSAKSRWKPEVKINIETEVIAHDEFSRQEVILTVSVTATHNETTAYIVEVKQAGMFYISGFSDEEIMPMLEALCPEILFPYARECIADLVRKGGYPQMHLKPLNFHAMYLQKTHRKKAGNAANE